MATKKSYTPAIIAMFLLFFMIAFVTNFAGSMGVIVKEQFQASNALSQLGTLANFIAYACMGIPAGILLKRKGYKFTALTAVVVGIVGVAIQWISGPAESFLVYVIGAFVAGFSMCLLNIVVNPMLNTLGGGGNKGNQLIQFGGSCNSIGGTIAPILLGYLVGGEVRNATVTDAAPAMFIAMGAFVLAAIMIAFTNIPEPHRETAEEKAARKAGKIQKDAHGPLSFRHFVFGAIAIFFYVGIEVGIPNTANVYFSGIDWVGPALTGTMIGSYWFCMMLGRLGGGAIGGKVSAKAMLATTSIIAIIFLICFIYFAPKAAPVVAQETPVELVTEAPADSALLAQNVEAATPVENAVANEIEVGEPLPADQEVVADEAANTVVAPEGARIITVFGHTIPLALLFIILCGFCTSIMWGSIFNLAVEGLGKYTATASGIFMTLVCGGGIIPFFQGLLADNVGSVMSYWLLIACLLYLLFFALVGSKNVNKDIKVD